MTGRTTLENLTDRSRKIIQIAGQVAADMGHNYVGTEHLLIGMVREGGGVAAHALNDLLGGHQAGKLVEAHVRGLLGAVNSAGPPKKEDRVPPQGQPAAQKATPSKAQPDDTVMSFGKEVDRFLDCLALELQYLCGVADATDNHGMRRRVMELLYKMRSLVTTGRLPRLNLPAMVLPIRHEEFVGADSAEELIDKFMAMFAGDPNKRKPPDAANREQAEPVAPAQPDPDQQCS